MSGRFVGCGGLIEFIGGMGRLIIEWREKE
jgi:hypothetical protein